MILSYSFLILTVILRVALSTLFERNILSYTQYRKGSNELSFKGLFQPFSDVLKLIFEEIFYLRLNEILYRRPIFIFSVSSTL